MLEELVLFVKLDELEGGTGSVTFFFGQVVVLVKPRFGVLLLDRHTEREAAPRSEVGD